jgi:hypothetical protein
MFFAMCIQSKVLKTKDVHSGMIPAGLFTLRLGWITAKRGQVIASVSHQLCANRLLH